MTLNAFQLEMTKALQTTEILKTRLSFLHQENRLISYHVPPGEKSEGGENEGERIRSGIAITLSRNLFEITHKAGYQKPKPRQFLQPPSVYKKKPTHEIEEEKPKFLKKPRDGKVVNTRPRFSSSDLKDEAKVKPRKVS